MFLEAEADNHGLAVEAMVEGRFVESMRSLVESNE